MAKIGYTGCLCGQNRVPFYFSVRHAPRTPSDWPTPATTRRLPHFRRVDPILATQLPKGTRQLYPTTRKWPGCSTTSAQRPTTSPLSSTRVHPCYRRRHTRTICLMSGSPGHKPPRPFSLSNQKSHLSTALSPSNQKPPQHSSSIL